MQKQITLLLQQTFTDFEIIISDNDPDASGKDVVESFNDHRVKYYHNDVNLGMIKSFNKSIERSLADYIVMVTDDDPVDIIFLSEMYKLYKANPGYSLYGGFERAGTKPGNIEIIDASAFAGEILNPQKTRNLLWSSCVLEKASVIKIGKIPDYGSPHLADHALLCLTGNEKGGVVINKMFSTLTSHNSNFSKLHLEYYYIACEGFYNAMTNGLAKNETSKKQISLHLKNWFIVNVFNLKKYYTVTNPGRDKIAIIDDFADKILKLVFMRNFKTRYFFKQLIFKIKLTMGVLK